MTDVFEAPGTPPIRRFEARFDSDCGECYDPIYEGDEVGWVDDEVGWVDDEVVCASCCDEAEDDS